jgi:hypothetical protein
MSVECVKAIFNDFELVLLDDKEERLNCGSYYSLLKLVNIQSFASFSFMPHCLQKCHCLIKRLLLALLVDESNDFDDNNSFKF